MQTIETDLPSDASQEILHHSMKTSPDKVKLKYRTLSRSKRNDTKNQPPEISTHRKNMMNSSFTKSPAKMINFEIDEYLFPVHQMPIKSHRRTNIGINFSKNSKSDRHNKSRYSEQFQEINRRGKGLRIITRIKYNQPEENSIVKKYMCIQKIKLPPSVKDVQSSIMKLKSSNKSFLQASTPDVLNSPNKGTLREEKLKTIRDIKTTKTHRRNHSSVFSDQSNIHSHQPIKIPTKTNKQLMEEFTVRKPVLRKDYFVFGMSERVSQESKTQYFRDFLWKINYSNGLHVHTPEQVNNLYRVYIGPGNNYHLIKGMMKKRFWWTIVEKPQDSSMPNVNFVWTQLKQNNYFKNQADGSNNNLVMIPSQNKLIDSEISCIDDHSKIFGEYDLTNWMRYLTKNMKIQQKITEKIYVKRLSLFKHKNIKHISQSQNINMHNHLQSNFYIGNKKALFYNMRKYLELKGCDPFKILPLTFHISRGVDDPEFKKFKQYFQEIQASKSKQNSLKNVWIVKPGQNTNRGNGITVCYSMDDIYIRLKGRERNSDGKLRTFIIQKYIENPLLYNRRKFDIRHYMLITCINGCYKAYWFEEGYIRTSSNEFNLKNCKDPMIHLTNDAIQKNNENYGRFQKGNKLSYTDFQRYLQSKQRYKKANFFEDILPKMKKMATDSMRATYNLLDPNRKNHNFELLGLDFMIDQDLQPWLIEINTNPCLEISSSLLQKIIPTLIDNTLKICLDPLFPPPQIWQTNKKIYFGDNPLAENKFQLIFDEAVEGREIEQLYKGEELLDKRMGKVQEDDEQFEDDGDQNWQCCKR